MTDQKRLESISKFLSLVLRHAPETIGLQLDKHGWADIARLIDRSLHHGKQLSLDDIHSVVATSDKRRFSISEDGKFIRANQGHSISTVDLQLRPVEPPEILYHGTADRFVESIQASGLRPGSRNHVHLSLDRDTAIRVGQRHGRPVVLVVKAGRMHREGYEFYVSANEVWLTNEVPLSFIELPDAKGS